MRGRAMVVAKDRVLAVSAVLGKATLSPVQPALEAEPPVPAAGGLEEVPTDRAHRAQLWRRRLGAGFAESLRDLYIDLELGERRSRTDAVRVDAAGHDPGDVDERLGVRKAVTEQRHELGPAGERPRAVAERGGGFVGARRPQELHGALFRVPRPRGARAASPRASLRSRRGHQLFPPRPPPSCLPPPARRPDRRPHPGALGPEPPPLPRALPPPPNARAPHAAHHSPPS